MARPRRRRTRTGTGPLVSCARFAVRHTHTVDRRRHALSLSLSTRITPRPLARHIGGPRLLTRPRVRVLTSAVPHVGPSHSFLASLGFEPPSTPKNW